MMNIIGKRCLHFTRHGELVSKPVALKSVQLHHPVLGKYDSEFLLKSNTRPSMNKEQVKTESTTANPSSSSFQLGQLVLVHRRLCMSNQYTQKLLGVIVRANTDSRQSIVVRQILYGTGVEYTVFFINWDFHNFVDHVLDPTEIPAGTEYTRSEHARPAHSRRQSVWYASIP